MDFEDELGALIEEALGVGGVEIDDVMLALRHQWNEVRLLKAEGDAVPDFEGDGG